MGVKSQCLKLERSGYLSSSRKGGNRGRPEVFYRLTAKARELLPHGGSDLAHSLLTHAGRVYGPQAANKLLFMHFEAKAETYVTALAEVEISNRPEALCALRTAEGHFASFDQGPPSRLIEGHNPLSSLFREYPEASGYETTALARALGIELRREEGKSGETCFVLAEPLPEVRTQKPPAPPEPVIAPEPPAEPQPVDALPAEVPPAEAAPAAAPEPPVPPRKKQREQPPANEEPFRLFSDF
jgi:predicted ArsR family transcriptional regulator